MGMSLSDINDLEIAALNVLGWDLTINTAMWATWLGNVAEHPDLVDEDQDSGGPDVKTLLLALLDVTQFMFGIQATTVQTYWEPPQHNRARNLAMCECLGVGLLVPSSPPSPPRVTLPSLQRQLGHELTSVLASPPIRQRLPSPPLTRFLRPSRRRRFGDELTAVTAAPPIISNVPTLLPPGPNVVRPTRPRRRTGDELYPVTTASVARVSPPLSPGDLVLDLVHPTRRYADREMPADAQSTELLAARVSFFHEDMDDGAMFCRIQAWAEDVARSIKKSRNIAVASGEDNQRGNLAARTSWANARKRHRSPTLDTF